MLIQINWKPTSLDLRKFGLTILIGFGLIGGLVYWKGSPSVALWMWIGSGSVSLLSFLLPLSVKPIYWVWMSIALVMGTIVSTLMLLFIYYFIFTPIGLLMRLFGRDALHLKKSSFPKNTYWLDHKSLDDKSEYERIF